ncbi:MAG: MATE family efflux transporter, partial [Clostridium sp.]
RGNEELISITKIGILIYYTSFMPMGLNVVNIAYLQSIEKAKYSSSLSILRGIILSITLVLILSNIFGIIGVWLAIPLSELITLIIAFIFINKV